MPPLVIPDFSLVLLVGAAGAGKSTFAARHFAAAEVVAADDCRLQVAGDAQDQSANVAAFELLHRLVEARLAGRRLAVVDATNLERDDRRALLALARRWHAPAVAIVLNPGAAVCRERNARRQRQVPAEALRRQLGRLGELRSLQTERFDSVHPLGSVEAIDAAALTRRPLTVDRRADPGPFDIIGDVHGCADELEALLASLGYRVEIGGAGPMRTCRVQAPQGRKAVFVGDLVDRGPRVADVLRLVMSLVEQGDGLCVVGNHDDKLLRWLNGSNVRIAHGLAESIAQLEAEPAAFRDRVRQFLASLDSHAWLDAGKLCVAHAGLTEALIGRDSKAVRAFALYGETSGDKDADGLPVRGDWAAGYAGSAAVVYGHTPVTRAEWRNRTLCVDTGCVFGGSLTALRYPEMTLVAEPAQRVYYQPSRPLGPP